MSINLRNKIPFYKLRAGYSNDRRYFILKDRLKLCFYLFIIYLLLSLLHIGCPIKFITGISCPGCGMTRAVFSVLRLNFDDAFYFHPLFFLSPIMLFLFLFEPFMKPSFYKPAWFIIILVFLIAYVIRLFFTQNNVVEIDIHEGIVLKLLHQISVGGFK
ncbi:MAG: DUF2752 domain-containing protein [Herbinix sp.]|nr:DUF2752 domain-containing protein [Herbinix sp.]